jgi:hypothetical protein
MVNILSTSQLVQKFLDYLKTAQPELDTKPGAVARDLFIDSPSVRIAELYNEISTVSSAQSFSRSIGQDLENLASNYSMAKLEPGRSSGSALLTFNSIPTDIIISGGSMLYARNGLAFRITSGTVISTSNENQYRSLATSYRNDLDYVNITDNYAVEVIVECTTSGTQGNIPKYNLVSTAIAGISGVTNVVPFTGGSSGENDSAFKNRVISIFSGANTGTELGYKNIVLANPIVLDAIVIGPADPLMTRDGTLLQTDSDGNLVLDSDNQPIILSEGTGGKVDVCVYGRRMVENVDSFIYNDKSGKSDATQTINDYVIGQIAGDSNKTITRRRKENIAASNLPKQPVLNILEVIGSRSGNFSAQVIDEYGNSTGNYVLQKDTGTYANSCWGSDKLHWVSNSVSALEDISKNVFNGQDTLAYSDSTEITDITRTILITNENSTVLPSNRSIITLSHTPVRNVNRVLNVTTGERYIVLNRNYDGATSDLNTTGRIQISGKNLPSISHILQVDYEWQFTHDPFIDFDSFVLNDNPRSAIDVVDWGYNNAIRREEQLVDDGYQITVEHNISAVISVNKITTDTPLTITCSVSDQNLIINGLSELASNVVSVKRISDNAELYNTNKQDGTFNNTTIILPSDSPAAQNDIVTVVYNAIDLFTVNDITGNTSNNIIYLNKEATSLVDLYSYVEVNYIANVNELLPSSNLSNLPVTKYVNKFKLTGATSDIGVQPVTNVYSGTLVTNNLRRSPCNLGITLAGIVNPGVVRITGKSVKLIKDIVINCVSNGLTQELILAIKTALNLAATATLSSYVKVMKLISLERVETLSGVVTNVLDTYDIIGYSLNDNSLSLDSSTLDSSLSNTEVTLPETAYNLDNLLSIGDKLRVSFYISTDSDIEDVSFSTNGTLYTNKSFAYINKVEVSSGFRSSITIPGAISIFALNQPSTGNRYRTRYDYTAPKNNERITIRYYANELIADLTMGIEDQRPITSDVIIKSTGSVLVDVTVEIKVLSEYNSTKYIVSQNVSDKIASYINNLGLNKTLNPSDIIPVAYQATGLDSIIITRFNKSNVAGNASKIVALGNEYMQSNNIIVTIK